MRFNFKTLSQGDKCVCYMSAEPTMDMDKAAPTITLRMNKLGFIYNPVERQFVCMNFKESMIDEIIEIVKTYDDESES